MSENKYFTHEDSKQAWKDSLKFTSYDDIKARATRLAAIQKLTAEQGAAAIAGAVSTYGPGESVQAMATIFSAGVELGLGLAGQLDRVDPNTQLDPALVAEVESQKAAKANETQPSSDAFPAVGVGAA